MPKRLRPYAELAYLPKPGTVVRVVAVSPHAGVRKSIKVGCLVCVAGPVVHERPSPMRCNASGDSYGSWFAARGRSVMKHMRPSTAAQLSWVLVENADNVSDGSVCRVERVTPDEEAAWRLSGG